MQTFVPPYYNMLKQQTLAQAERMGMDLFEVQDFVEQKGLYENNFNIILDQLRNPGYVNPLKHGAVVY